MFIWSEDSTIYIWWETLTERMQEIGFTQSKNDPCVYHRPTDRIRSDTGRGMVHTGIQEEEADLQEYGYVRSKKDPNMYVR